MYNLSKYDSVEALKIPVVQQTLPRYGRIVMEDLPAKFQIAKKIVFEFDDSLTLDQMWKEHDMLVERYYETQKAIDAGKLKFEDLETPRFSLLDLKILITEGLLESCILCEHRCEVNRIREDEFTKRQIGKCKVSEVERCIIASEQIHLGEEAYLTPSHTIFFMGCNFDCQYCQNWRISQWRDNSIFVTPEILARVIKAKREDGARNVNYVGGEPTPQLLCILKTMKHTTVNTPQIWNSNFWMTPETMKLLAGVVDMYLSDFKYGRDHCAHHLSKVDNYFEIVSRNHLMAARQAEMTIRHLILPGHIDCCTEPTLRWIGENLGKRVLVNLMDQYCPAYLAHQNTDLKRRIDDFEKKVAIDLAQKYNLNFVI